MSEIDVSKCLHYEGGICYNVEVFYKYCEQCPDCMRKQFPQLKAENEELKKLNEQLATYYPQENNELLKYKQCLDEIEELQNELCRRCDLTFCGNTVCYKILQKIKEVKNG